MTFGPLTTAPVASAPSSPIDVAGAPELFGLVADLLDYPEDDLVARAPELAVRAAGLPDTPPARLVVDFCRWFGSADPDAMREAYVATFDHSRRNALYVTYATNGDTRRRGAALLAFKQLYEAQGFVGPVDELPDFLPTVLRFAAVAPADAAGEALAMAHPGIELVAASLSASHSPWAGLLEAARECLPPLDEAGERFVTTIIRDGPPTEEVGVTADLGRGDGSGVPHDDVLERGSDGGPREEAVMAVEGAPA